MDKPAQRQFAKGSGFTTALRAEAYVTRRTLSPWLLAAIPALAVLLRLLLVKLAPGGDALDADTTEAPNGYGYMVDGFSTGLTLLYLIFIAYSAYTFAIDRDMGVVRHLTIRRISRRAFFSAKLVVLHCLSLLSLSSVLLASWLLSRLFWDLGPVVEDGFEIIDVATIVEEVRTGLLLALLPLPACLALGLLISVIARSATQAVAVAIGLSLVVDIFKNVLGDTAYFLYASFQPSLIDQSYLGDVARIVRGYSDVLIDPDVYQLNLWVPIPQALFFVALALLVVSRRRL